MSNATYDWKFALEEQPEHPREVLVLQPRLNEGYITGAGKIPCSWAVARWKKEPPHAGWHILESDGWHSNKQVWCWREMPDVPPDVEIIKVGPI